MNWLALLVVISMAVIVFMLLAGSEVYKLPYWGSYIMSVIIVLFLDLAFSEPRGISVVYMFPNLHWEDYVSLVYVSAVFSAFVHHRMAR